MICYQPLVGIRVTELAVSKIRAGHHIAVGTVTDSAVGQIQPLAVLYIGGGVTVLSQQRGRQQNINKRFS